MASTYHGGPPAPAVSHDSASRPSLGFPLGTALLLLVIFSLSGIFSCCYHWDKLRRTFSLRSPDLEAAHAPSKPKLPDKGFGQRENQSLPVIMPGDSVPRFIALPCPCEPPRKEELVAPVAKPPPPPKPPRIGSPFC
ncbi:uncharacterized protein At5g65660 [Andrographis paniculata]|uniref:uncharacterized protein At5g65660 n=1 Tax=Andrographis paniculata TaxID=175694 RepID=UPI0021E816DE|nr:uncharacterized protein At5g65660 [Andrographis paniculata]